jgi:hypothetical protein
MAHPGLLGGMARPCASRSAARVGRRPRVAPVSPPQPVPNMAVFALSSRAFDQVGAMHDGLSVAERRSFFGQPECADRCWAQSRRESQTQNQSFTQTQTQPKTKPEFRWGRWMLDGLSVAERRSFFGQPECADLQQTKSIAAPNTSQPRWW